MKSYSKSYAGRKHRGENKPCEDASASLADSVLYCKEELRHKLSQLVDSGNTIGTTITISADGASGADEGKEAAEIVVETVLKYFLKIKGLNKKAINKYFSELLTTIKKAFKTICHDESECCTTMNVFVMDDNWNYLAIRIGDGSFISFDYDLNPYVIATPYNVNGQPNQTCFVHETEHSIDSAWVRFGNLKHEKIAAIAVITDGMEYLTHSLSDGPALLRRAAACTILGNHDDTLNKIVSYVADNHTEDDVSLSIIADDEAGPDVIRHAELICASDEKANNINTGIMNSLKIRSLTPTQLVNEGYCTKNHVLTTMIPLIRSNKVCYNAGTFNIV